MTRRKFEIDIIDAATKTEGSKVGRDIGKPKKGTKKKSRSIEEDVEGEGELADVVKTSAKAMASEDMIIAATNIGLTISSFLLIAGLATGSPICMLIGGVGTAVFGFAAISGTISNLFKDLLDVTKSPGLIGDFARFFSNIGNKIVGFFKGIFDWLSELGSKLVKGFGEWIMQFKWVKSIVKFVSDAWDAVKKFSSDLWDSVAGEGGLLERMRGGYGAAAKWANNKLGSAIDFLSKPISKLTGDTIEQTRAGLQEAVPTFTKYVGDGLTAIRKTMFDFFANLWREGMTGFDLVGITKFVSWFKTSVASFVDMVGEYASPLYRNAKGEVASLVDKYVTKPWGDLLETTIGRRTILSDAGGLTGHAAEELFSLSSVLMLVGGTAMDMWIDKRPWYQALIANAAGVVGGAAGAIVGTTVGGGVGGVVGGAGGYLALRGLAYSLMDNFALDVYDSLTGPAHLFLDSLASLATAPLSLFSSVPGPVGGFFTTMISNINDAISKGKHLISIGVGNLMGSGLASAVKEFTMSVDVNKLLGDFANSKEELRIEKSIEDALNANIARFNKAWEPGNPENLMGKFSSLLMAINGFKQVVNSDGQVVYVKDEDFVSRIAGYAQTEMLKSFLTDVNFGFAFKEGTQSTPPPVAPSSIKSTAPASADPRTTKIYSPRRKFLTFLANTDKSRHVQWLNDVITPQYSAMGDYYDRAMTYVNNQIREMLLNEFQIKVLPTITVNETYEQMVNEMMSEVKAKYGQQFSNDLQTALQKGMTAGDFYKQEYQKYSLFGNSNIPLSWSTSAQGVYIPGLGYVTRDGTLYPTTNPKWYPWMPPPTSGGGGFTLTSGGGSTNGGGGSSTGGSASGGTLGGGIPSGPNQNYTHDPGQGISTGTYQNYTPGTPSNPFGGGGTGGQGTSGSW